jgi:hypothetical protein
MTEEKQDVQAELFCHKCKTSFSFEAGIKERKEERGGVVGVTEYGIQCPNPECNNWVHAYWMSIPLDNQRKALRRARIIVLRPNHTKFDEIRFKKLQRDYQGAYDKFQNKMYKLTGTKPTMVKEHVVE